jgi:hypothetical protein
VFTLLQGLYVTVTPAGETIGVERVTVPAKPFWLFRVAVASWNGPPGGMLNAFGLVEPLIV